MATFSQVCSKVWQTSGVLPGLNVVIMGGTHGNELTGIHVVNRLLDQCPELEKGKLTLILGNPKAIERTTRGSVDHADLNRCFTKDILNNTSVYKSYEHVRARELEPYLRCADIFIDLHSTNKPSFPFLRIAGKIRNEHLNIARWFPCDTILSDPKYQLAGQVALTDEYVGECGGLGLCYESGIASDTTSSSQVFATILNVLGHQLKLFELSEQLIAPPENFTTYQIEKPLLLKGLGYEWAENRGTSNFEVFKKGELIGKYRNNESEYADRDLYLVFPKIKSLWKQGSPLGYLCSKKRDTLS